MTVGRSDPEQRKRDIDAVSRSLGRNMSAIEALLDEHTRGEHKVPHPDCGACRVARQMARGQMP